MKKTCTKCLVEKDELDFHMRTKTGRRNECKKCVRDYQSNPRVMEIKRLAQRKYAKTAKGIKAEGRHSPKRQRRIKETGRDKIYYQVRHQLEKKPCHVCGLMPSQAHHHDYSKPLDVIWLCPIHHAAEHREERRCG